MNLNNIKNQIKSLEGKKLKIKINLGRNKHEFHEGTINKTYSNIFTVLTENKIITISYADIATKMVVITKFD